MTAHSTALVVCPDCRGSGDAPDGKPCGPCFGQKHYAIDRTPDGGIPSGYIEWVPPLLSMGPDAQP